ncbi:MAG: hypothetical protein HOP34_04250 [Methylococcaceae bacterium]|nr:hypothetical protein [Methylococcaceae bacterium]
MHKKLSILLIIFFNVLSACTLMNEKRDNETIQTRIDTKIADLSKLDSQNQQLSAQANKLIQDLDQKHTTLDQLQAKLNQLKSENDKLSTSNEAERRKKEKLAQTLHDSTNQVNALNKDKNLSIKEKNKKLEALKQEIKEKIKRDALLFQN